MRFEEARRLYAQMKECTACIMRKMCTQVVTYDGFLDDTPLLLVIGESPGADEDREGRPFVGDCGILLRQALRATKILKKNNTIISNTLKCRPPNNKFPQDKNITKLCVSKWLDKEIEAIEPKRMLLLGNVPLGFVADLTGITKVRGTWITVKGVRTLATFHPSYVIRCMNTGDMDTRKLFFSDIQTVAEEVSHLQEALT
jgi:uracil-DNA glycosylase family 4